MISNQSNHFKKQTRPNRPWWLMIFFGYLIYSFIWSSFLLSSSKEINLSSNDVLGININRVQAKEIDLVIPPYPVLEKEVKVPDKARSWLILDSASGKVIASKNQDQAAPIASTTKIMTAMLVLENVKDLSETIDVPQKINTVYQNQAHLRWGESFTVSDLLYILMLESDNQAANVLASYVGKKKNPETKDWTSQISQFVKMMNDRALSLQLTKTHFQDPAGLDEKTTSTPFELALLTKTALKNNQFKKIVSTPETTVFDTNQRLARVLKNSNRLVSEWFYPGIIGVKTGFLPNTAEKLSAGHCLVAAAERDQHQIIVVILNTYSETAEASARAAEVLLNTAFNNVKWY